MFHFGKSALLAVTTSLLISTAAQAAVDIIQAPTGHFTPAESLGTESPYYRWGNEDWAWQHNAIASGFTSAQLHISAYDVDYSSGEINEIWAHDNSSWVLLGQLTGADTEWSFTTFDLDSRFFSALTTGLRVHINIDAANEDWGTALGKSIITTDGSRPGNPIPGVGAVPEPATWAMFIVGFGLVGTMVRRRKAVAA